jgi:hypothetical protein
LPVNKGFTVSSGDAYDAAGSSASRACQLPTVCAQE